MNRRFQRDPNQMRLVKRATETNTVWGCIFRPLMRPFRTAVWISALLSASQAAAAEGSWLDVKTWRATFTHTLVDEGEKRETTSWGMTTTTKWSVNHNFRVVSEFTGRSGASPNSRIWGNETNLEHRVTVDESLVETKVFQDGKTVTTTATAVDGYNPDNGGFWLTISMYDNTYTLSMNDTIAAVITRYYEDREPYVSLGTIPFSTNAVIKLNLPGGTNGVIPISGGFRCLASSLKSWGGGPTLGEVSPDAELEVTWFLEPLGWEDEELVVEISNYDTWLPEGSVDEQTPGNTAVIRTRLQKPDGSGPEARLRKLKMELISVSHEPGVCLNFPVNPDPVAPADLQFLGEQNPDWRLQFGKPQALVMESVEGEFIQGPEAILSSFDWGAYGLLRVTAQLTTGRTIVGHLVNDSSQSNIRIPKRADGSYTAQAWKQANEVAALDDMNDSESDPVGDGHEGDGLTLYEEYRGFYEGGPFNHITGNPRRKDLFVRNRTGDARGFALAASLSGLEIHHKFTDAEFPGSRIINANHSAGSPHRVDQHGVVVVLATLSDAAGRTCGGPSIPKHIDRVLIGRDETINDPDNGKLGLRDAYATLVAHELLHACNVWHHGPTDQKPQWRVERGSDGSAIFYESGKAIRVLSEDGSPYLPEQTMGTAFTIWLGAARGAHSGDDKCVMRYQLADAYVSSSDSGVRYWVADTEPSGTTLCSSPTGTGVNAIGRLPQSRYGDAQQGGCRHQICVNDAMEHPRGPQNCQ